MSADEYGKTIEDCKQKFASNIIWSSEPVTRSQLDQEKLHYERLWSMLRCIHSDAQLLQLFVTYGPEAFRRSSVLEGFEAFIKANDFRGETVVEIGSLKGLTAMVLARYFKTVVTIDIAEDPQKYKFAKMLGVKNIEFVNVLDNEAKARVCAQLEFDAAYMDGDHAKDTAQDFAMLKKCGRVLAHEHWAAQPDVVNLFSGLQGKVVTKNKWALWTS